MNKVLDRNYTEYTVFLEAEEEFESPEHMERTSGAAKGFAKCVRRILKKAPRWGWCSVKVTVVLPDGRNGEAYLGGCSYAKDFIKGGESSYYPGMVRDALAVATKCPKSRKFERFIEI
jgi:hypothetical protein